MTIEITHQDQAEILKALRAAQDKVKEVYHAVRDRSGEQDPHHPALTQMYALRDSLIELETPFIS